MFQKGPVLIINAGQGIGTIFSRQMNHVPIFKMTRPDFINNSEVEVTGHDFFIEGLALVLHYRAILPKKDDLVLKICKDVLEGLDCTTTGYDKINSLFLGLGQQLL